MAHPSAPPSSAAALRRGRRGFIKMLGGTAAGAVVIAGCDTSEPETEMETDVTLDFSTDVGVLNYAYALEQLEAAFYAQAAMNPYADISATEQAYLDALAAHEGVHRDLFAAALGGDAIPELSVDFSGVDFDDRASVLGTAQVLEDTGVAAYNGAGRYLTNADFLTLAGKIVSVEARHAAAIRAMVGGPTSFADLGAIGMGASAANGLDAAQSPGQILQAVAATGFVTTGIAVVNA